MVVTGPVTGGSGDGKHRQQVLSVTCHDSHFSVQPAIRVSIYQDVAKQRHLMVTRTSDTHLVSSKRQC